MAVAWSPLASVARPNIGDFRELAIENGHRNSGFSHEKWVDLSIAMLVHQRVTHWRVPWIHIPNFLGRHWLYPRMGPQFGIAVSWFITIVTSWCMIRK